MHQLLLHHQVFRTEVCILGVANFFSGDCSNTLPVHYALIFLFHYAAYRVSSDTPNLYVVLSYV